MDQLTTPVGCVAGTATPEIVVVRVVVPPRVGLLEAVTPIIGDCWARVSNNVLLLADA